MLSGMNLVAQFEGTCPSISLQSRVERLSQVISPKFSWERYKPWYALRLDVRFLPSQFCTFEWTSESPVTIDVKELQVRVREILSVELGQEQETVEWHMGPADNFWGKRMSG